ncbi:MAG: helix-turn-helix domain-containing protein [Streptomyces sp.]|nr:helix-turn-helix domain-containing protein [Streptomyces sp.]
MPTPHWRRRVEAEDREQQRLLSLISESARRRAQALEEGAAELGTKSEVARVLGISPSAVRRAIREHGTGTLPPADSSPTTTE